MEIFVWLLYHNQEIGLACTTFIIYKIFKEENGNATAYSE